MPKMSSQEFRRCLEFFEWTQDQAAPELGVSVRSIHGWANGANIPVAVQKFLRVIINYEIPPDDPSIEKPIR